MESHSRDGEIFDTASSYFRKTDTVCTQSMKDVASYSQENRHITEMGTTVMEAYLGDVQM